MQEVVVIEDATKSDEEISQPPTKDDENKESNGPPNNNDDRAKSKAFLERFETEETRFLTNEELQRMLFLKQLNVLDLQQRKLELEINNPNNILFDISGLNLTNGSV